MCLLARVRTAAAEHTHFAFTECCFSVAGTLILNLVLPEAAVVSVHVTEMAVTLVLESWGWEETFPWPISTGSQGLAPRDYGCPGLVSHPVAGLPGCRVLEPEGALVANWSGLLIDTYRNGGPEG